MEKHNFVLSLGIGCLAAAATILGSKTDSESKASKQQGRGFLFGIGSGVINSLKRSSELDVLHGSNGRIEKDMGPDIVFVQADDVLFRQRFVNGRPMVFLRPGASQLVGALNRLDRRVVLVTRGSEATSRPLISSLVQGSKIESRFGTDLKNFLKSMSSADVEGPLLIVKRSLARRKYSRVVGVRSWSLERCDPSLYEIGEMVGELDAQGKNVARHLAESLTDAPGDSGPRPAHSFGLRKLAAATGARKEGRIGTSVACYPLPPGYSVDARDPAVLVGALKWGFKVTDDLLVEVLSAEDRILKRSRKRKAK